MKMNVEVVRIILERTFGMPVAESDAQIVLDRWNEYLSNLDKAAALSAQRPAGNASQAKPPDAEQDALDHLQPGNRWR